MIIVYCFQDKLTKANIADGKKYIWEKQKLWLQLKYD